MNNEKFSTQADHSSPEARSKSPPECASEIELVFERLVEHGCQPHWITYGHQIVAFCPMQCDSKMSLLVKDKPNDERQIICSTGCSAGDIYTALSKDIDNKTKNEDVNDESQSTKDLLDSVCRFVRRFVVLPDTTCETAVSLFVLHTWAFDAAQATPYLAVVSAEKQSGKTLLLEVLELLVREPWRTSSTTEAALFRKIERDRPTLLLDEIDAVFGSNTERTEPLRAALNAGNREGAKATRVVGQGANMEPRDFSVFCPKVLAGIDTGRLPETIQDRSVTLHMKRRRTGEQIERLRYRFVAAETEPLRSELATWGATVVDRLSHAVPDLPDELADRTADAWEPLLAIAELAGGDWPTRARVAAVGLRASDDETSRGVQLLDTMRRTMEGAPKAFSAALVKAINADEELPFGAWNDGKGIDERRLAKQLRPFGVRPHSVRIGTETAKGYSVEDLADVWARYLPPLQTSQASRADQQTPETPHEREDVTDVADVTDTAEAEDDQLT
jgi:hypothetical protein